MVKFYINFVPINSHKTKNKCFGKMFPLMLDE